MKYFSFGRKEGFPSRYSSNETPVILDLTETIFIALFSIIGVAYLSIVLGNTKRQSTFMALKVILSITIGCLLIVSNFGQEWEVGIVETKTPYRAGIEHEINATIGVKIGFRSVNITLQGEGKQGTLLANETINYNERFWWTWDQGRFGFGPEAGLLQRSFREAQRRGTPIPILWIAEYFVIDGEGIRFGRFFRTAGWCCHILMWTAFSTWLLANIFLQSVGRYTAYCLVITGLLQILTCLLWFVIRNPFPLVIPFEDNTIRFYFGQHFWMTLFCGHLCLLLALILIVMDLLYPNALSIFLNTEPFTQYDECIVDYSEYEISKNTKNNGSMEMNPVPGPSKPLSRNSVMMLKRKSMQRTDFRYPVPVNLESQEEDNDQVLYLNLIRTPLSHEEDRYQEREDTQTLLKSPKKVPGRRIMV